MKLIRETPLVVVTAFFLLLSLPPELGAQDVSAYAAGSVEGTAPLRTVPVIGPASPARPSAAESAAKNEVKAVALIRFGGSQENVIAQFGESLQQALEKMGGYSSEVVDMNNLPPDVPPGGFPPYVCPSPSMTKNAPYSLTGELTYAQDDSTYHLRLYLWEMENNRLLFSDELTAADRSECDQNLPPMLQWLFSWLKPAEPAAPAPAAPLAAVQPAPKPANEEKLIYAGLRLGPSLRFYNRTEAAPFVETQLNHFYNISAALQGAYHIASFFEVQTELIFTTDYAPFTSSVTNPDLSLTLNTASSTSSSLMIPVLAKFVRRKDQLLAAAFLGVYAAVPLGKMQNDKLGGSFDFSVNPPLGYTLGFDLGMKAGSGHLFLDIRWTSDLGETKSAGGLSVYQRDGISLSIGYEMGFITKNKK